MTSFKIKVIAIISMVVDHIGLFFFPNLIILRMIGRVAFPLFAWLIANGAHHTKNIEAYLNRLFIFALISQVPYYYASKLVFPDFNKLNILFTLFIGLLAIKYLKETNSKLIKFLLVIFAPLAGHLINVDFGAIGVVSIIFFFVFFENKKMMVLSQSIIYLFQPLIGLAGDTLIEPNNVHLYYILFTPVILLTLVIIFFYNNQEGRKMKYFFYLFYPLQYIVFYAIKIM
jgi:hypothetical protein